MIESNAARLEKYVKDLLQVAKLHDGEIQINKASISMERIVQDVVETYRPLANNKGLQIQADIKPCDDIQADHDKVNLILSNLLANAIKFSDSGSINVTLSQNGSTISCHVTDQGCGIPEKDLSKVFDRFFQGTNAAKGSGIGLAIAKGWAEAHGGEIHAESDGPGKGSRFWFTLPK
jgi:signal transduction histidine kinase